MSVASRAKNLAVGGGIRQLKDLPRVLMVNPGRSRYSPARRRSYRWQNRSWLHVMRGSSIRGSSGAEWLTNRRQHYENSQANGYMESVGMKQSRLFLFLGRDGRKRGNERF